MAFVPPEIEAGVARRATSGPGRIFRSAPDLPFAEREPHLTRAITAPIARSIRTPATTINHDIDLPGCSFLPSEEYNSSVSASARSTRSEATEAGSCCPGTFREVADIGHTKRAITTARPAL